MTVVASRLSRNTLTLLVSNGGGALLSFVLSALIGRALGADGLGVYATALAWVFPLWMVAEFGLGTLITRDVAQTPASAPEHLRAAAVVRLGLGGGLMLLLILAAPYLSDQPLLIQALRISAPLIVIGPFFGAFSAVFRAHQVMWPVAALNIGMLLAQVTLTALVFLRGGDVLAALVVNVVTSAGQLVAAWAIYYLGFSVGTRRPKGVPVVRAAPLRLVDLFRRAWPFALAAILAAVQLRLSVILLAQLRGAGEAGQYTAAARFVEAGRMMPQALFGALFPALSVLSSDSQALNRLFRRVLIGLAVYGLLVVGGATLFAPVIIRLTFGPDFDSSAVILPMLAWSLLPGLLKSGRIVYCYAQGREQFVNRVTAGVLLLQLVLSVWLIDGHGAAGVALALIVVEIVALVWLWRG